MYTKLVGPSELGAFGGAGYFNAVRSGSLLTPGSCWSGAFGKLESALRFSPRYFLYSASKRRRSPGCTEGRVEYRADQRSSFVIPSSVALRCPLE